MKKTESTQTTIDQPLKKGATQEAPATPQKQPKQSKQQRPAGKKRAKFSKDEDNEEEEEEEDSLYGLRIRVLVSCSVCCIFDP